MKGIKIELNNIYNMDCIDGLKLISDNTIDTIITDPPYGLTDITAELTMKVLKKWISGEDNYIPTKRGFMGKSWDAFVPPPAIWKEIYRVMKPGATALVFAGTRTQDLMTISLRLAGFEIKDTIMWLYSTGFPHGTDISKQLDKKIINQNSKQIYYETLPIYNEAKLWDGWKSHSLKPAYEPIILAIKSNEKNYANNAIKYGVSGLNIKNSKIGIEEIGGGTTPDLKDVGKKSKETIGINKISFGQVHNAKRIVYTKHQGRFPANIILDEEAGKLLDKQSGIKCGQLAPTTGKEPSVNKKNNIYGDYSGYGKASKPKDKLAGASRFFYCAKASKSEKNKGLIGLEKKQRDMVRKHGQAGTDNPYNRGAVKMNNFHPSVKPLSLLKYLCTLTNTPTGGIVLDPFLGSGTTAIACIYTNRDYIGFELNTEYYKIADKRIKYHRKQIKLF